MGAGDDHVVQVILPRRDYQSTKEAAQTVWDALENAGLEGFAINAEERETDQ